MTTRPSYRNADREEREAQLSSRTDVLTKSFATELWMRVIQRAIDDVALFRIMRVKGKELKEEELEDERSAKSFLFDEDYAIVMDDYLVDVDCPKCKGKWTERLSSVVGQNSKCPLCENVINKKYISYTITPLQTIKEITMRDLISIWGVEDLTGFRIGLNNRINEIVKKKLEKLED